jgi:hypothetical protein
MHVNLSANDPLKLYDVALKLIGFTKSTHESLVFRGGSLTHSAKILCDVERFVTNHPTSAFERVICLGSSRKLIRSHSCFSVMVQSSCSERPDVQIQDGQTEIVP